VADHQHALPLPTQLKITEETADAHHCRPPGLATWVRRIEIRQPLCVHKRRGHPIALAVVAFSEPPVMKDRKAAAIERESCRLHRPSEVRREDGRESVVASTLPEFSCEFTTSLRESSVVPSCRAPEVVVFTPRMRFEDDVNTAGHANSSH
jgi:hypothetical protein